MRLDVKNLNFGYTKKVQILHNINFSVESGQLVSLIGPNGSGKTTIIKCTDIHGHIENRTMQAGYQFCLRVLSLLEV